MTKANKLPKHTRLAAALLPLGALAAGLGLSHAAPAQTAASAETVLPVIRAKVTAEPTGKDTLQIGRAHV